MLVEMAGGATPASEAGGDPAPVPLTRFAAILDRAESEDASLRARLCLLTAFSRAADQAFADLAPEDAKRLQALIARHSAIVRSVVAPALAAQGLAVARWEQLDGAVRSRLGRVFERRLYAALTPLTVDSTHPFPQPPSLSLNLAVRVVDHFRRTESFATLTIPPTLPRLLQVATGTLLPLEYLVAAHLDRLFPDATVESVQCFRVTRALGRGLRAATRLELEASADEATAGALRRGLDVAQSATYRLGSSLLIGPALATLIPLCRSRRLSDDRAQSVLRERRLQLVLPLDLRKEASLSLVGGQRRGELTQGSEGQRANVAVRV